MLLPPPPVSVSKIDDGYDETFVPLDFKEAGQIVDDDIFDILVRPMPAGVTMTVIVDCCHSGTILDLPFSFAANNDVPDGNKAPLQILMQADPYYNFGHWDRLQAQDRREKLRILAKFVGFIVLPIVVGVTYMTLGGDGGNDQTTMA